MSVLPSAETAPSITGIMLVVVLPTSIMTQVFFSCEIIQPVAAQFAAATFAGSDVASCGVLSSASTSRMRVVVVGNAFVTWVRMWLTPSRFVRYASESSAVMVTVTRFRRVDLHVFFVSFRSVAASFSGFFQTGKYSDAVSSFAMQPFLVVMNAALVFAPPMSKPMTLTVLFCLLRAVYLVAVFLSC